MLFFQVVKLILERPLSSLLPRNTLVSSTTSLPHLTSALCQYGAAYPNKLDHSLSQRSSQNGEPQAWGGSPPAPGIGREGGVAGGARGHRSPSRPCGGGGGGAARPAAADRDCLAGEDRRGVAQARAGGGGGGRG